MIQELVISYTVSYNRLSHINITYNVLHFKNSRFAKMDKIKVGILRENKMPHDRRVPFTPLQCALIMKLFPNVEIAVQSSEWRSYLDAEYKAEHIPLKEDVSDSDILMGIKEVPKEL